jgi:hypothetical protein
MCKKIQGPMSLEVLQSQLDPDIVISIQYLFWPLHSSIFPFTQINGRNDKFVFILVQSESVFRLDALDVLE